MDNIRNINRRLTLNWLPFVVLILVAMSLLMIFVDLSVGLAVAAIPMVIVLVLLVVLNPFYGYLAIFLLNYTMVPLMRYAGVDGLSVIMDSLLVLMIALAILHLLIENRNGQRCMVVNGLVVAGLIWLIYCSMEVMNPTSDIKAWFLSRSLTTYMFVIPLLTTMIFREFKMVKTILIMLSILTLLGVAKAIMQQTMGFDAAETQLLNSGMYRTHLLPTGIRYFSFFASAGIFGAAMGHALVVFAIVAIYTKNKHLRIFYIIVALAALYGLVISGTRGALAVPGAGFLLFILLSKQIKIMIPTIIISIGIYVFLAMTHIGQSNATIRRMRSAFDPNEPSLVVRRENQKLFREYLKDKPFGEGLGLSGVDARELSDRYTTSIATDSWYVKIWVETGVVGLLLHLALLAYIVIYGSYIVFFKLKNIEIRGVLMAFICGIFGIFAASYGNQILGQFPVAMVVYMCAALVFMGPYFERELESV